MRSVRRALLFILFALTASAQEEDARIRAFRDWAAPVMKAQQVEGLSIAIAHGDFRWSGGLGLADIENSIPATASSSYRLASVTKPMTAVAVLKLAEEGKIDLDAEVQTYVPWFPRKAKPVTVRQLLAHQGGISHYRDYEKEGRIREPKNTREAIAIFADFDLVAEPGTAYRYTSYGYNLLGAVIEGAAGKPYAAVMREKVWAPLGMSATRMDDPRAVIANRVPGYVVEEGKLRRSEYIDVSSRFAGGGTRSTVDDMVRFMEGLAAGKVLSASMLDNAWTAQATRDRRDTTYGLGFGVYPRNGRWLVGHTGAQQETRTSLVYAPSAKFTVALASNFEHVNLDAFENKLFELFLGDPPFPAVRFDRDADQAGWRAVQSAYDYGVAWYDRHGRPMTSDRRELDAAFRYFREAFAGDASKSAEGRHPLAGQALVKVGSWMASALAAQGDLDRYHREGALAFFGAYAKSARQHRLDRNIAERIAVWQADAARVLTPELASIDFHSKGAVEILEKHRDALLKSSMKPDYARDLVGLAEAQATGGNFEGAARTATLGLSIYPNSEGLNGIMGVLTLLGGDRAKGTELMRRAVQLDARGYAGAENLIQIASFLEKGMKPAAVQLLEVAAELHPADETLRARLAEMKQ